MNRDPRVDAYIARAQPFARPILEHVRNRVHALLPNAEETTKWSAPAYTLDGKILLIMAAFKAHAALNFWRGQELRGKDADPDGMGQFGKLTSLDDLPGPRARCTDPRGRQAFRRRARAAQDEARAQAGAGAAS